MTRAIRFLPLLLLFILPAAAFAEGADEAVKRLQERYDAIATLTAGFTQEVYPKGASRPQVSTGKVYFKKPGRMRWVYEKPSGDELVSNGRTVWVFQPDLNQVVERPADAATAGIATDFLSGVGSLKKDFDISLMEESGGSYRLGLAPKKPMQNLKNLSIELDKGSALVTGTSVVDVFGNETRISFRDIKTNASLKDSFFEFKAPKGSTVIRP